MVIDIRKNLAAARHYAIKLFFLISRQRSSAKIGEMPTWDKE
jgi:hypothetical protein